MYIHVILLLTVLLSACLPAPKSKEALTTFVNPFMGTDGPGNTYPGAQYPFGSVQLSPDHGLSGWDRISGYSYRDTIISGFSYLHLSGTGAGDLYDLLFMPVNNKSKKTISDNGFRPYSIFSHDQEGALPGYYWVNLKDFEIKAEMTAGKRVGIQRYTFPEENKQEPAVILDLGHSLNWDSPVSTSIKIIDNKTIVGYRKSSGWAKDQRVYFKAEFSQEFKSYELFVGNKEITETNIVEAKKTKAKFNFNLDRNKVLEIKVAIAFSNIKGAEGNFKKELKGKTFDDIRREATLEWEKQLNKIIVTTPNKELKKTFYTTLYQTMLNPRIYSDEEGYYKSPNGNIEKSEKYTKYDLFSLWDTFRATHPLYTIMHSNRVKDMIHSMLSHYKETGLLPVWSFQGNETNMMIGYHSVPVIVDAYFKGLLKGFNKEELYEACKTSAMQDLHDIDKYKLKGFVPSSHELENWSVSKTLEYAYDDWTIARFAHDLKKEKDYKYFMNRADNWKNHYDSQSTFLVPLKADGNFVRPFSAEEYTNDFCESNGWQYFWFVPHNIQGLIDKLGGEKYFENKLDSMFSFHPVYKEKLPIFSTGMIGQYAHGNEPSHHVGYLYNYINKSWKTQKIINKIIRTQYSATPDGHCGNEDCGQMSAWFIFSSMGLYPVNPADGNYIVNSPMFENVQINLENGRTFEIIANNVSESNFYINSVKLNGKILEKSYISYKDIEEGGNLIFEMSSKPNKKLWIDNKSKPKSYFIK